MRRKMGLLAVGVAAIMMMSGCSAGGAAETKNTSAAENAATQPEQAADDTAAAGDSAAAADEWQPQRDITIRVPIAAGGNMDTVTRLIGQGLQSHYKKTVMVNNITGANGAIAASDLLSAAPAAEELMACGINTFTLAPLFNTDIKMNLDDFTIVSGMIADDFILYSCPGNSGIETWEQLQEYGKDNRVIFSSNNPGGTTHMLATAIFGESGIEAEAIASDGSAKDLLALVGNHVVCSVAPFNVGKQYLEEGTLVPLMVFSEDPVEVNGKTVPTAKSLGYDIVFRSSNFLMTRKEVDQDTADQIYQAIQTYYQTDEFKTAAATMDYEPDTSDGVSVRKTIEEAAATCQRVYDKYYKQ